MARTIDKRHAKAPLFDSDFIVAPYPGFYTARSGNACGDSAALGNLGPVVTIIPTCIHCGRTGPGVEDKPFMHAIPRSLWRATDREAHGSKFANADSLIFLSDLACREGRDRIAKLAIPVYRCTEEVRASRVKVMGKHGIPIVEMMVEHGSLGWYCPCDELDAEGDCLFEADDEGEHDGCGGRKIDAVEDSDDNYLVFNDVDKHCSDRYMHWKCATKTCDACNIICPANMSADSDDWVSYDDRLTDLGKPAFFCGECAVDETECHGSRDYAQNSCGLADPHDFCEGEHKFSRLPALLDATPRLASFYCENHMPKPSEKVAREHPTKEPTAKRPTKTSASESESDK